jgi:NAD(P)-dependent dehydrogenase (short-subunit alcohol dehydrogenase family)
MVGSASPVPVVNLQGKRVLITQAGEFMGPALCEVFAATGAEVIADSSPLVEPGAPAGLIAAADCFVGQVFPVCGGWVAR